MRQKAALILPVIIMLTPFVATATTARLAALGETGSFTSDERNVMRWYGAVDDYSSLFVVQSGHFAADHGYLDSRGRRLSGPAIGAHVALADDGDWGTGAVYYHGRGDDADPGSLHRGFLNDHISLLWGRNLGTITIGLLWRDAGETAIEGHHAKSIRGRQEAGFGFRYDLGERAFLDVAGETRRLTDRAEGTDDGGDRWATAGHDSWRNYGFRARVFWGVSERVVLVPVLELITEDFTGTQFADGGLVQEVADNRGGLWRLGCGLNFMRDPDNLWLVSTEIIDGHVDHELHGPDDAVPDIFAERYTAFLAKAAFEKRLAFWLTGRASLGYEHFDNAGDLPHPESRNTFLVSAGAGVRLGDIACDLAVAGREPRGFARYAPTLEQEAAKAWFSATVTVDF